MKTENQLLTTCLSAALVCASLTAPAQSIVNGGFESGFTGWTRVDQLGSEGTFASQSGTLSPVNGLTVPAPPQGTAAAMTDAAGPGSHVLYQDFLVPMGLPGAALSFSLFINNGNGAPDFYAPATLDFATPALNQQARVDIITTTADPFSVAGGDVLQNLFQTAPGNPLVSGYTSFTIDISALLLAHQGETLRLRFADADNVAPFNLGVDSVGIAVIPEPSSAAITSVGLWVLAGRALRRRAAR